MKISSEMENIIKRTLRKKISEGFNDSVNPLNEPVPQINVPVLTPKPVKKIDRVKQYAADKIATAKKYAK